MSTLEKITNALGSTFAAAGMFAAISAPFVLTSTHEFTNIIPIAQAKPSKSRKRPTKAKKLSYQDQFEQYFLNSLDAIAKAQGPSNLQHQITSLYNNVLLLLEKMSSSQLKSSLIEIDKVANENNQPDEFEQAIYGIISRISCSQRKDRQSLLKFVITEYKDISRQSSQDLKPDLYASISNNCPSPQWNYARKAIDQVVGK